jgi:hypothetical protein
MSLLKLPLPLAIPGRARRPVSLAARSQLNSPERPEETLGVHPIFGFDQVRLQRTGHGNPELASFLVIGSIAVSQVRSHAFFQHRCRRTS